MAKTDVSLYALAKPVLAALPPETAHRLTIRALEAGLAPRPARGLPGLPVRLWGLDFANPVGLAAGFDKDARAMAAMLGLGFGFVEIGTVTPRPQAGNPRPRMFRLPAARAVINRMGFNSGGMAAAAARLAAFRRRHSAAIVGVNLGKNRDSEDAAADYAAVARRLAPYASYLAINVSSPNTPGLRALQDRDALGRLVAAVREAVAPPVPPLLVKIAPDLDDADRAAIAAAALDFAIDGLIVGNTTTARPAGLTDRAKDEAGGLSGRPLMGPSTALLADIFARTGGRVPLVGVGGISSGDDAYAKIRAGAALVQLYTALAYEGPGLVGEIVATLARRLAADGFATVAEAVGADHRQ
jgi:dihydroorotate dehydrogenase